MINGKVYDWEDVTVALPYGIAILIDEITYDDELAIEPVYGKGAVPRAYGRGNYKASGKIGMKREEFNKLNKYAALQGRTLYGLEPFPIVVSYADDGNPTTVDELPRCKINKSNGGGKQGDKEMKVTVDFQILQPIIRNGVKAYK